jgi:23S rRNA (cytosine1962-C5)-methyltransferase
MPAASIQRPALIVADRWRDYQLIECGDGMKQEKWGEFTLVRPDPQIIWPRHQKAAGARWEAWDGFYHRSEQGGGKWEYRPPCPTRGKFRTSPWA